MSAASDWLSTGGVLGGVVVSGQFAWAWWKDRKGGTVRRSQAETAKAVLDANQAEQSLPHVQRSLELGNIAEAVAIQQGVINGLRDHAGWQDDQLREKDQRIQDLEERLASRDEKVRELEERLRTAEDALSSARETLEALRLDAATDKEKRTP